MDTSPPSSSSSPENSGRDHLHHNQVRSQMRDELQQSAVAPSTFRRVGVPDVNTNNNNNQNQIHQDPAIHNEEQRTFNGNDDDSSPEACYSPANGDDDVNDHNDKAKNQNVVIDAKKNGENSLTQIQNNFGSQNDLQQTNTNSNTINSKQNRRQDTCTQNEQPQQEFSPESSSSAQEAAPLATNEDDNDDDEDENVDDDEDDGFAKHDKIEKKKLKKKLKPHFVIGPNGRRMLADVVSLATSMDDTTHGVPPDHNLGTTPKQSASPMFPRETSISNSNNNNNKNAKGSNASSNTNNNNNNNNIVIAVPEISSSSTNSAGTLKKVKNTAQPNIVSINTNNQNPNSSSAGTAVSQAGHVLETRRISPPPSNVENENNTSNAMLSPLSPTHEIADDNEHRQLPREPSDISNMKQQQQPQQRVNFATSIVTIPADNNNDENENGVARSPIVAQSSVQITRKKNKMKNNTSNNQQLPPLPSADFLSRQHQNNPNDDDDGDNNNNMNVLSHDASFTHSRGPHNFVDLDPVSQSENLQRQQRDDVNGNQTLNTTSDTQILGPLLKLHGAMTTCFNGLCIVGPQLNLLLVTTGMIVVPFIMLAAGIMPYLTSGLIFMDVIFFVLTLVFLFRTAFSDPGVVEKRLGAVLEPHLDVPVTVFWSNRGDKNVDVVFGDEPVPKYPAKQRIHALKAADEEMNDISIDRDEEDAKKRKRQKKRDERKRQRRAERRQKRMEERKAALAAKRKAEGGDSAQQQQQTEYDDDDDVHDDDDDDDEPVSDGENDDDSDAAKTKKEKEESVNTFRMNVRYCRTCCRYKGLRTFHCDVCKACIDGYDHHCPFTGTCIGHNNYTSFMGFMLSLQLFILFTFISAVSGPVDLAKSENICLNEALRWMGGMPIVLILMIFFLSFGVSGLLILHVYLSFIGKTTMEHLREKYLLIPNPFDRGWKRNLVRALGAQCQDRAAFTSTFDPLIVQFERRRKDSTVE